jgi:hypothetical protein
LTQSGFATQGTNQAQVNLSSTGRGFFRASDYITSPAVNNTAFIPAAHFNSSTGVLTIFLPSGT